MTNRITTAQECDATKMNREQNPENIKIKISEITGYA
jgi:hypothetical protein